jgi:hypothetical protein
MPFRTKNQNSYTHGSWNVICDVCGFKFKSDDIKKRWDGMMVCKEDWEPRHESDFYRAPKEDPSVPYTRSDSSEAGGTDIEGGSFPPTEDTTLTDIGTQVDEDDDGYVDGTFGTNNRTL